jgi:hypothetical protein
VDTSLPGARVVRVLDRVAAERGYRRSGARPVHGVQPAPNHEPAWQMSITPPGSEQLP